MPAFTYLKMFNCIRFCGIFASAELDFIGELKYKITELDQSLTVNILTIKSNWSDWLNARSKCLWKLSIVQYMLTDKWVGPNTAAKNWMRHVSPAALSSSPLPSWLRQWVAVPRCNGFDSDKREMPFQSTLLTAVMSCSLGRIYVIRWHC